jgi:hypothetical protein
MSGLPGPESEKRRKRDAKGCAALLLVGFLWFVALGIGMSQADSGKQVSAWVNPLVQILPLAWIFAFFAFLVWRKM